MWHHFPVRSVVTRTEGSGRAHAASAVCPVWCLQGSPWRTREAVFVPTPCSGPEVCNPNVLCHSPVSLREVVPVSPPPLQPLTAWAQELSHVFIVPNGSPINQHEGTWLLSISVGGSGCSLDLCGSHRDSKTSLPGDVPYHAFHLFLCPGPYFFF